VKNLFVGAPLIFGKSLRDEPRLVRAAAAVAIFCVISSAVYLWNDLIDVDEDRQHPTKRNRPIASGALAVPAAQVAAALFASVGLALAYWMSLPMAITAGLYLALNVAYTLRLKHVPYVDVFVIASGFLLRVMAGAFAVDVHPSRWLLVCAGLLACFFGFGKRQHELATIGAAGRRVLRSYHPERLRYLLYATGSATVIAYLLYTRAEHTIEYFHTTRMVWTVPLVVIGMGRYGALAGRGESAEPPTDAMLRDPLFVATVTGWALAVVAIIYFAG
jgi:4-hydroxybenzoate polyprenyltransferase